MADAAKPMTSANPYAQPGEHPRLDWHLDNWTVYVFSGATRLLRCKTQSHWASGSSDFDKMVAFEVDLKSAQAVDALVWDEHEWKDSFGRVRTNPLGLTPVERGAVLHLHIDAVWRSNRIPMEVAYMAARLKISIGLLRRHVP